MSLNGRLTFILGVVVLTAALGIVSGLIVGRGGNPVVEADEKPTVGTIEDIMLALQYRKDFLSSGFKLLDTHGGISNPGFISQEQVDRFPKAIGADAEVKRMYYCLLSREDNTRCLSYHVTETANHAQAVAIEQAWAIGGPSRAFSHRFVIRNVLVMVMGFPGAEVAAEELMFKLKDAVNYAD